MIVKSHWLRIAFHLLYHQLAWTYDFVSTLVSLGKWRDWQRAALPFLQGPCVLELGHGPGHMLITLSDRGDFAVGLDLSPQMGRLAQRTAREKYRPARLVRSRAEELPFADHTFDSILATFPTPYILAPATIDSAYQTLKPGGRLVIVPEARLTGHNPLVRFLEWVYRVTGQRYTQGEIANSRWDPWQIALSAPGFQVEVRQISLPGSIVTVMIARRPEEY